MVKLIALWIKFFHILIITHLISLKGTDCKLSVTFISNVLSKQLGKTKISAHISSIM